MKITRKTTSAKKALLLAWIAVLVISLSACGNSSGASGNGGSPSSGNAANAGGGDGAPFTLRAVTQTTLSETIIADRLGFFEDEGIKIAYIGTLGQGITQEQALATGDIDIFTQGHLTQTVQARMAGLDPVVVAPGFVDDPEFRHVTYLVREDSDIQGIEDFIGKKVGVQNNSLCFDGYITKYLKDRGLDADKVEYVTLPQAGQAEQAVLQGQIDVTTSHSPFAGTALAAGGVRIAGKSWDIFESPAAGLATRGFTSEFIKKHPDVVQRWMNAMYHARVFMDKYPEYSREVGADYMGLSPDEISMNRWPQEKTIPDEWAQLWFDLSEELGYWEHGAVDPWEAIDTSFVPTDYPAKYDEIVKTPYVPKGKA